MELNPEVIDPENIVPLYKQLAQYLRLAIDRHQYKPGDRIPSENELIKMFKVSRVTVRRAIQELIYQEKVVSVAGKGCFVIHPKLEPLSALTSFSENIRAQGYEPSYRDAIVTYQTPSKKIASLLKISDKESVMHIHRLMLADGEPMAISNIYLPERVFTLNPTLFTPEVLNQISLYKIIELELGLPLFRADEWVDAGKATSEEANLLNIQKSDLVLIIDRVTYSNVIQGPIEYVHQLYTASKYRYKVELFRSQKQRQTQVP